MLVTTAEELKAATKRGDLEIIVTGDLADTVKKTKKAKKIGAAGFGILALGLLAAPFTGGASLGAGLAATSALSAGGIAAIIAASGVSIALIYAIHKDYEELSYHKGKLVLRKRASQTGTSNGDL
jgi:hypothetical protein